MPVAGLKEMLDRALPDRYGVTLVLSDAALVVYELGDPVRPGRVEVPASLTLEVLQQCERPPRPPRGPAQPASAAADPAYRPATSSRARKPSAGHAARPTNRPSVDGSSSRAAALCWSTLPP